MNTTMQDLTLDNFTERTGFRFRISREQKARIAAGSLTRETAFREFLERGGLEKLQKESRPDIPDSVYLEDGLTLDNFAERVQAVVGVARRFRVSQEQHDRIKGGSLSREGALVEVIEQKRRKAASAP